MQACMLNAANILINRHPVIHFSTIENISRLRGCEFCKMTGFQGRQGIYEFLVMSDPIKEMVIARQTASQIKNKAVSLGMKTLRQDGWEKVKKGLTTPAEVIRVTQEEIE